MNADEIVALSDLELANKKISILETELEDYRRIEKNARELDRVVRDVLNKFRSGDWEDDEEREYWQGKKDGLRLAVSMLRPHLAGCWLASLESSPGAIFLESEEKLIEIGKKQERERYSREADERRARKELKNDQ